MMDENDPLQMSFSDALTCVFGAAIALFLIFVVLVKFAPATPYATTGLQAGSELSRAVQREAGGKSSVIIQAYSEARGNKCVSTTSSARRLAVTSQDEWEIWDGVWQEHNGDGLKTTCVRLFTLAEGLRAPVTLVANEGGLGDLLHIQVQVGAIVWPSVDDRRYSYRLQPKPGSLSILVIDPTSRDNTVRVAEGL